MNLRIITRNHVADPEIGILKKSIPKPYGRATAMPTAWELRPEVDVGDIFRIVDCPTVAHERLMSQWADS